MPEERGDVGEVARVSWLIVMFALPALGASSPDLFFFGVSYLVQFCVGAIDAIEDLPNCVDLRGDPLLGQASARRCRPWTSLGKSMKRPREAGMCQSEFRSWRAS